MDQKSPTKIVKGTEFLFDWSLNTFGDFCHLKSPVFSHPHEAYQQVKWQMTAEFVKSVALTDKTSTPEIIERFADISLNIVQPLGFVGNFGIILSHYKPSTGQFVPRFSSTLGFKAGDEEKHLCSISFAQNESHQILFLNCSINYAQVQGSDGNELIPCELSSDMGVFLEEGCLSDFTIKVAGKEIKVHKAILASRSAVFRAMFGNDLQEKLTNEVTINDMDYDVVQEMVGFIYTGKVPKLKELALHLLYGAEKYGLKGLKASCEIQLKRVLKPDNAIDILLASVHFDIRDLKKAAVKLIAENVNTLIPTKEWEEKIHTKQDLHDEITLYLHTKIAEDR